MAGTCPVAKGSLDVGLSIFDHPCPPFTLDGQKFTYQSAPPDKNTPFSACGRSEARVQRVEILGRNSIRFNEAQEVLFNKTSFATCYIACKLALKFQTSLTLIHNFLRMFFQTIFIAKYTSIIANTPDIHCDIKLFLSKIDSKAMMEPQRP